jgi:uncharacterized protein (UPF0332 family)
LKIKVFLTHFTDKEVRKMYDPEKEDFDSMLRKARIKSRDMQLKVEAGNWDSIITDAYNVMYMAARGALGKMGYPANTHQTVASQYRRLIIDGGQIDKKFADHLTKIKNYWEGEQKGEMQIVDKDRAKRIVQATLDLVDALAKIGSPRSHTESRQLHYNQ